MIVECSYVSRLIGCPERAGLYLVLDEFDIGYASELIDL